MVETALLGADSQALDPECFISVLDRQKNQSGDDDDDDNDTDENEDVFVAPVKRDGELSTGKKGVLKHELEEINRQHQDDIENERRFEEIESQRLILQLRQVGIS